MGNDRKEHEPLRVLVVDDSSLYRKAISDVLSEAANVEVVGVAANGQIALDKIELLAPHLLTLDLEMPELDGHGVLREIQTRGLEVGAIVLSAFTSEGARATTRILQAGAFDFALKPTATNPDESRSLLRGELLPKISAYHAMICQSRCKGLGDEAVAAAASSAPALNIERRNSCPKIIGIGVSTGGPAALGKLIPALPADLPVPVALVQHMPPIFTKSLADELDRDCRLTVREARHGDLLAPGTVTIAPGGRQMKVEASPAGPRAVVTDDPPERSCRPSVDYLFRSLAECYGGECLAIIMTGMGDDGLLGCKLLKRHGATIVAQDEASSVVYGMPRQIVENGLADVVCSLDRIPLQIQEIACREVVPCT